MRRRARRRRVLWAFTALLVIAGFALLAWPPPPQHLYSQTVQIGEPRAGAKFMTFDAADVTKPTAIEQIVGAVNASPSLDVEIHSTASRRRVTDAADVVRSTAQVIAPARAEAEVAATDSVARTQRQRLAAAETRLGNASPAASNYPALVAARDTARAGAQSANAAHRRAVDAFNALRTRATNRTVVSPVSTQTADGPRPFWPVAAAVILQVIAIIAADILFVTRTRWVPEHERNTVRAARKPAPPPPPPPPPQPKAKQPPREDRPAARHRARTRPRPRTTSGRVVAKPLDLPNLEVHFIGGEKNGQRAVELRDAPGGPEDGVAR